MWNWLSEFHLAAPTRCSLWCNSYFLERKKTWRRSISSVQHISSVSEHITDGYQRFVPERRRWPPLHIHIHFHSHFPSERRSVWRRSFVRCAAWESAPPHPPTWAHISLKAAENYAKVAKAWNNCAAACRRNSDKNGFEFVICRLVQQREKKKVCPSTRLQQLHRRKVPQRPSATE